MMNHRRILIGAVAALALAGSATWAVFRFLVGESSPAQLEYLPAAAVLQSAAASAPAPSAFVVTAPGKFRLDFSAETVGAEPKALVPAVGHWVVGLDGGRRVVVVDGRAWAGGQTSAGLADKARALYGERYAEFLDNVKAYAYYPIAVLDAVPDFREGSISVRFKGVAGRIDQGAGILFNLQPNGDYLSLRANPLEDNLVLWKYEKGRRSSVKWIRNTPTPSGQWHELKLTVAGKHVEGFIDGKLYLSHELDTPVAGRIGLWSKADSVVYFDEYRVVTGVP